MPFFCYWLHSLLRWKECRRLGISGSFCVLSRVDSAAVPQPALCDSQERAVLQKMWSILMKRGAFLNINRSIGHGFVSNQFFDRNQYVRKDRIWFQIPVRKKKKLRISVPDPEDPYVFGSPGSGSVIYLHGFGSFHQQAKSYEKPGFLLLCDSLITFYLWRMK